MKYDWVADSVTIAVISASREHSTNRGYDEIVGNKGEKYKLCLQMLIFQY